MAKKTIGMRTISKDGSKQASNEESVQTTVNELPRAKEALEQDADALRWGKRLLSSPLTPQRHTFVYIFINGFVLSLAFFITTVTGALSMLTTTHGTLIVSGCKRRIIVGKNAKRGNGCCTSSYNKNNNSSN